MRVLFDTNVVLDLLLEREPFVDAAASLFARAERGQLSGYVCATTITTIHYLAAKVVGAEPAREAISTLLSIVEVAPVNRAVTEAALESPLSDFEDAVLLEAARSCGVQSIVTRNASDFVPGDLPIFEPTELLAVLRVEEDGEG